MAVQNNPNDILPGNVPAQQATPPIQGGDDPYGLLKNNQYIQQAGLPTGTGSVIPSVGALPGPDITEFIQPVVDPDAKKAQSKDQMPQIVENAKQATKSTFYQNWQAQQPIAMDTQSMFNQGLKPFKNVDISDAFVQLNDGTYKRKYKNYQYGVDNEDRLARQQGTFTKWMNGIGKFALKTGLYGASGLINPVYGLLQWAKTGNFSAVYDNEFMNYMDDLDTKMNYNLPNYYRKEERDYNFLRSMGTANFWANDLLGGAAFTTGAIVSQGVLAYLTGGASIGAALVRGGMRSTGKLFSNNTAKAARSYFSNYKKSMDAYLRGATARSKVGELTNLGLFLGTSTSWEASVESFHFLKDTEEQYKNQFKMYNGRNPNEGEMAQFKKTALSAGNTVFAANIGILSLSNSLMFGQFFGVGTKAIPALERSLGRTVGIGVEAVPGKVGIYQALKPTRAQKIIGTTFHVLKRPMAEGVWEEGGQGTVSKASTDYVLSGLDPRSEGVNASMIESLKTGFKESFGTKEGFKEVGIGMIIGTLMGGAGRARFGFSELSNQQKVAEAQAERLNDAYGGLNTASINTIKRSIQLNRQIAATQSAEESLENHDIRNAARSFDQSLYSVFSATEDVGLLENTRDNFKAMMDSMDDAELAKEMGISVKEVSPYKEAVMESYDLRLDDYRASQKMANLVVGEDGSYVHKEYIGMAAYLGMRAKRSMDASARNLERFFGRGLIDASNNFAQLDAEHRSAVAELAKLNNDLAVMEQELLNIQARTYSEDEVNPYNQKLTQKEGIVAKMIELEKKISTMPSLSFDISQFMDQARVGGYIGIASISPASLVEAYNSLQDFDAYLNNLYKTDPAKAQSIYDVVQEFRESLIDFRAANEMMYRMSDPRFMRDELSGISKALANRGNKYIEQPTQLEGVSAIQLQDEETGELLMYDEKIDESLRLGKISEDEAFTFRAYNHMKEGMRIGIPLEQEAQAVDPISDTELSEAEAGNASPDVIQRIADRIYLVGRDSLSKRQGTIYNKYKTQVDAIVNHKGDRPQSRIDRVKAKVAKLLNRNMSIKERNQSIINDARDVIVSKTGETAGQRFDSSIEGYIKQSNLKDKGEAYDYEGLQADMDNINSVGAFIGVSNLLDFIEQNRLLTNGRGKFGSVIRNVGIQEVVSDKIPESKGRVKEERYNTNNPSVLVSHTDPKGNVTVAGLTMKGFVSLFPGYTSTEASQGVTFLTIPNSDPNLPGIIITLNPGASEGSFRLSSEDARAITDNTDITITGVPAHSTTNWSVVYRKTNTGWDPVMTDNGFGKNGTERIAEKDVLSVKKDDNVELTIDINDAYNQQLMRDLDSSEVNMREAEVKWNNAKIDPEATRETKDAAERVYRSASRIYNATLKRAKENIVVKINHKGNFVSVLKSTSSETYKSDTASAGLVNLRKKVFDRWDAVRSGREPIGENGTIRMEGSYKIGNVGPGRANYNMVKDADGNMQVQEIEVSEEAKKSIVDIGYMLNGEVHLKGDTKFPNIYPYATKVERNSKEGQEFYNRKIPIVVIRHPNGRRYAYPVSLKSTEISDDVQKMIDDINLMLANPVIIDGGLISGVNNFIARMRMDPNEYQIPISGYVDSTLASLQKVADELERIKDVPDVDSWLTDSRSPEDIAQSDVMINIDLGNTPFIAPKISLDLADETAPKSGKKKGVKVDPKNLEPKSTDVASQVSPISPEQAAAGTGINEADFPFNVASEGDEAIILETKNTYTREGSKTQYLGGENKEAPVILNLPQLYNNTGLLRVSSEGISDQSRDVILSNRGKALGKLRDMIKVKGGDGWYFINSETSAKGMISADIYNVNTGESLRLVTTGRASGGVSMTQVEEFVKVNKNAVQKSLTAAMLRANDLNSQHSEQNNDC